MSLITKTDIAAKRQLSNSVKSEIIDQYIADAELEDLAPLLGEIFYNKIANNVSDFTTLLTGGTYTYQSNTYSHTGIKSILIDFAYARYIMFGSQTDTPFGFVEKQTQDSNSVTRDGRKERYKALQQSAIKAWSTVENYLNRNTTTYADWTCAQSTHQQFFKTSKITN